MLGVGDFYYELGIQIIEVCLATSHQNGGRFNLTSLVILSYLHSCDAIAWPVKHPAQFVPSFRRRPSGDRA